MDKYCISDAGACLHLGGFRTLARSYFMQLFDNCVDPASGFCSLVCCFFHGIIEKTVAVIGAFTYQNVKARF